jgi:hypothetical protein
MLNSTGADIAARDVDGNDALGIAAQYNQDKTCERHLFLFRWQQRAKQTKKSAEPKRMAHQFNDSAFPVCSFAASVYIHIEKYALDLVVS